MVLETLVTEGKTKDFLVGLGRGYLEIPNEFGIFSFSPIEPRTIREYHGRRVGKALFMGTCLAVAASSLYAGFKIRYS
jgi:hypothetical protein